MNAVLISVFTTALGSRRGNRYRQVRHMQTMVTQDNTAGSDSTLNMATISIDTDILSYCAKK